MTKKDGYNLGYSVVSNPTAPCLVDYSWTQICLESRILLRFGAVDKSPLPLKRLIELTPVALAQQIHVPHFKINTSGFKMI